MSKSFLPKPQEKQKKAKRLCVKSYATAIGLYEDLQELNALTSNSFLQGRMFRRLQELNDLCSELGTEAILLGARPTLRTSKRSESPGGQKKCR